MIVIAGYLNFTADQTKPVKQEAAAETAEKIREENIQAEEAAAGAEADITSFPDEDLASVSAEAESTADTETPEGEKVGEAVLTSSASAGAFSASAKLNREQVRSKNEASLLEIINNTDISEDMKADAFASMNSMTDRAAKELAAEYGIDYRSPVFAIHKNGHYGSIVGYGFDTMKEYAVLVRKAADQGADFIKIMTTGLMDFKHGGRVTGSALSLSEVKEMVHIAHEEGFSVMSHTNGDQAVRDAIESGVDSIEHGKYISEDPVRMLADSSSLWVPTVVTVYNLIGDGRYEDEVLKKIWEKEAENLQAAWEYGPKVVLGSDGGAYRVLHGQGLVDQYRAFQKVLGEGENLDRWIRKNEEELQRRFRRG